MKCDGTRAETSFRLSAKRTSPFKSMGASVQSTTGIRGVRISGSNAGYTVFRGSVKSTGYPLHSPVSPSLSLPYVTVCHRSSTGLYQRPSYSTGSLPRCTALHSRRRYPQSFPHSLARQQYGELGCTCAHAVFVRVICALFFLFWQLIIIIIIIIIIMSRSHVGGIWCFDSGL